MKQEASEAKEPPDELLFEEDLKIEVFEKNKNIKTSDFSCGVEALDRYARQQISQDVKRGLAVCYFVQKNNNLIAFYTLSSATVDADQYLTVKKKGVGPHLPVPVTLIGRLAVDVSAQGKSLGGILLLDAIRRAIASSKNVASKALIVDAIDENAVSFYEKFGFVLIPGSMKMLLTMDEAKGLV